MRVTFDTNILDDWIALPSAHQTHLSTLFQSQAPEPRCTLEIIEECLAIGGTNAVSKLPGLAGRLCELIPFGLFRFHGDIIISELTGKTNIYMSEAEREPIARLLKNIAKGQLPTDLADLTSASTDRKAKVAALHQEHQCAFRKQIPQFPKDVAHLSFEDFWISYWIPFGIAIVADLLRHIGDDDPRSRAAEIVAHPLDYPWVTTYLRTHAALTFRYYALNRKVCHGDLYDASQLVYLVDCDLIVSNDVGLRETSQLVWGTLRQASGFATFLEDIGIRKKME